VDLPAGNHQVEIEFHPVSLYVGLGLFFVAVVSLAWNLWREKR
jgi:hypothetical protein